MKANPRKDCGAPSGIHDEQVQKARLRNHNKYLKLRARAIKLCNPAYYRSCDLKCLDEEARGSVEIKDIGKNVVGKLNEMAKEQQQGELVFIDVEKAEFVDACCGRFYFLRILVEDYDSRSKSSIEKMVWVGNSGEVLKMSLNQIGNRRINSPPVAIAASYVKRFLFLADLVMFEDMACDGEVELVQIISVKENEETVTDGPAMGLFKFKKYSITMEVGDRTKSDNLIVEATVLNREWFQIMDNDKAELFHIWKARMLKATFPPNRICGPEIQLRGRPSFVITLGPLVSEREYYSLDLCSPQILTQVWLALEDYYYKESTKLELVKLIKATRSRTAGIIFNLTFQAKDKHNGIIRTFHIELQETSWLQYWKPITPLHLCQMEDEVGFDSAKFFAGSRTSSQ